MSQLTNKQESYSHFKGISFDESSYTLTPTRTGDRLFNGNTVLMSSDSFVRDGLQDPTISNGPMSFQNAYKFTFNNVTPKSSRLYFGSTTTSNFGDVGDIRRTYWEGFGDGVERVYSIWLKMPDSVGTLVGTTGIHRVLYGNSPVIGLGVGTSVNSSTPAISLSHVGENASLTATYTSNNSQYPINFGEWYLVSIVKSKVITGGSSSVGATGTGNLTYKHYINGVLVGTLTAASFTNTSVNMITWGHNSSATPVGSDWSVSLAGWFVTDWDVVGSAGLAEIYATFSNPVSIADPINVTATIVDPVVSTESTVVLADKILSYSPELYWQFNETPNYTTPNKPTNLGSYNYGTSTWNQRNVDSITPYLNAGGGVRGTGSWIFALGGATDSTSPDYRLNTTQSLPLKDGNSSVGYFFKTNFTLSNALVHDTTYQIVVSGVSAVQDKTVITAIAGGAANSSNKGKALFTVGTGTSFYSSTRLDDQKWHYVAVRQNQTVAGIYTEIYLDGNLINSQTVSIPTGTINGSLGIGDNSVAITGNGAFEATTFEVSDIHVGTYLSLTSSNIAEINATAKSSLVAAPGVSVSHTAEVMTATTTLAMPTIVAVIGDSVNITTSFTVSADFPTPAYGTGQNITINADLLLASGVVANNYILTTNRDDIISVEAFLATALFREPILARESFRASATMPGGTASVAPNYFSLVKNLNPVFYIEDGQAQPVEHGTWNVNNFSKEFLDVNVQADEELNVVGNQKCWMANANGVVQSAPELMANITNYETLIENLYLTRNLSIEVWYWSKGYGSVGGAFQDSGPIFHDGVTQISEVYDFYGLNTPTEPLNKLVLISDKIREYDFSSLETAYAVWRTYPDATPKREAWNHLVVTYEAVLDPNQIRRKVYLNGAIVGNEVLTISTTMGEQYLDIRFSQNPNSFFGPKLGSAIQISGSQKIKMADGVKVDEFAIYPVTLSGSQVLDHHSFIRNLSPDTEFNGSSFNVGATMGNHVVTPVQNTVYESSPMTGLGIVRDPAIIGGKSKNISVDPFVAQAFIADPAVSLGLNYLVPVIVSYAESANHIFLNDIYYEYVQATIAPYRYVTFDQANTLSDYGTDNDYSVNPTTIGGTVVNPDLGINGRSVLTSGTSYITGGVILNESEWNDSWGTGANNWHSAFWFQRSQEDQSTTGLRVLWNLNGYNDNQHAVLYQYQGRLHMQFNNGSGTFTETDSTTLDLFDYNPHFVVIDHNHGGGNNNTVKLYVDSVLRFTVNIGSITPTTTNAASADSGPNEEANNRARLSIGCLITPFASTALPVVPSNTKLIIDEIYWDKNTVTQTQITNIYNKLPGKTFAVNLADPSTATALIVAPTFSIEINKAGGVLESLAQLPDPIIAANRNLSIPADAMVASALIADSPRSDSTNILAEFMLASASFNSAGTPRLIRADVMNATALFQNRRIVYTAQTPTNYPIRINGITTFEPTSAWVRYVRSKISKTLNPMKEVS